MIDYMLQREFSFSCYSKGELKFHSRVFPHRVCPKITSLDLIGVIEDEEFFSKICDEDVVRDSKPIVELRPTFGEYLTEWWRFKNELLKNYIPRTPTRTPDLFDGYLLKVVSGRQRKKYSRIMTEGYVISTNTQEMDGENQPKSQGKK
nr:phospholipase-like protein [Tanacetum cinerariifolium]